ncbi:Type I restriction modification DNA specificity domain, partial [Mycoplasmopsis edwardii]
MGDICKFKNGKAHEQYVQKNGKYIIINSKFISSNKEIIKRSNICLTPLFKDEIVMVLSDIPNGKALAKTVIIEENNKFTLNQRIGSFKVSGIHNAKFINLILNRNKYFLSFDDKVNQTNLSNSIILGCKVLVTSLHEENNISKLFLHLNNLITLHQRKLKALENIKMTLLDKMFPDEKSNIPSIRFEEFTNAW